ncbi:hypothetical protein DVH05_010871 [Phytophthora capsici]|nr:hypothetical protein DVH05_010871 [Phytophthora capsici]
MRVRRPALATPLGIARILFTVADTLVTTDVDSWLGRARGGDSANHDKIRIFGQLSAIFCSCHDLSPNYSHLHGRVLLSGASWSSAIATPGAVTRASPTRTHGLQPTLWTPKGFQSAIVEALRTTLRLQAPLTIIQVEPSMPAQTQSLPTWASIQALPSVTKAGSPAFDEEDPLYLSGEETDCDSERGSDTLSHEDQQLMANFIRLQRERKQGVHHQAMKLPAVARTTPVLIPAQTRKYVATSTKRWIWDEEDEEDDECDQCPCCNQQSVEHRPTTVIEPVADVSAVSDLMFDLEL